MINHLQKVLGTYKAFEWNVHCMHWMARGPINGDFHLRMKDAYEYAQGVEDDAAERIIQLHGEVPLKMCDVMDVSEIQFLDTLPDMEGCVKKAIELNTTVIEMLKTGIKMAAGCDDYHTEDLFRNRCAWHEVFRWKLEMLLPKALSSTPKE